MASDQSQRAARSPTLTTNGSATPTSSRTPKTAQVSSSVPSTPYQRARDYRFHSRSPSPHRGIGSHSPKSTTSDALGLNISTGQDTGSSGQRSSSVQHNTHHGPRQPAATGNAPVVCRYETGDEIRKRRIPYVDGGNEELPAPSAPPRETLTPTEQIALSAQMQTLYTTQLLPSTESEDRRKQLVEKLQRILTEEWPDEDIKVSVFGSSGNLLSSTDSDVDVCITTSAGSKALSNMHALAALLSRHGMEKVVCRAAAKVPIVKCWDPKLELAADLNVNNPLALQNTKMIKTYVQLDERIRPLAKVVKHWTKQRILNDAAFGGTISSYTWICMVISFLQRRKPPILPSLQKLEDNRLPLADGDPATFADDVEALRARGNENKESLGELLFQFFRHYGYEFEYSKSVVSVREGRLVSREEKGWEPSNYHDKEARNRLCVEEPFTINRNLGNSADDYAWHGIHGEIRRAFDLLADGLQLDKCCEQYEFPPEEKHVFQRPTPKPKPTLTRSASQSGRSDQQQGSRRSRKDNRNQSSQRSNNRRASSGASFGNTRMALPFMSPTISGSPSDYFGVKGNLHEQLYQQYQYLQLQQDALRAQVQQVAQAQAQAQARNADLNSSPRPRPMPNGLPSPRHYDAVPQNAPLLPGYLYHYPAQYLPPSPMSQTRSTRDGSSTSPSSPSVAPAVPALRRQVHRASVPELGSPGGRSQSQPGRSIPNAVTQQQHAHPGYDVSGAIPAHFRGARASQIILPGQQNAGFPVSFPHSLYGMVPPALPIDPAAAASIVSHPKEYVGYYVGQSPQLGPQQSHSANTPMLPQMNLRDPPQRPRRVTPDLVPPMQNGRHVSRSPSPLSGHLQDNVLPDSMRESQTLISPTATAASIDQLSAGAHALPAEFDLSAGPIIVNGSNRSLPKPTSIPNGILEHALPHESQQYHYANGYIPSYDDRSRSLHNLQLRTDFATAAQHAVPFMSHDRRTSSPGGISPTGRKSTRRSNSPKNRTPRKTSMNGVHTESHRDDVLQPGTVTPPHSAQHQLSIPTPLLSPVAELRTPSPTRNRSFDLGVHSRPDTEQTEKARGREMSTLHGHVRNPSERVQQQESASSKETPPASATSQPQPNRPVADVRPVSWTTVVAAGGGPRARILDGKNSLVIPPYRGKTMSGATNGAVNAPIKKNSLHEDRQGHVLPSPTLTARANGHSNGVSHTHTPSLTKADSVPEQGQSATGQERNGSLDKIPPLSSNGVVNTNQWQQATRKGHKKSRSVAGTGGRSPVFTDQHYHHGGQPIPANEADRKGG